MRIDRLTEAFRDRFGRDPDARVRAPGRVNLLGEHLDYNDLPVLPMAIDRAVEMVVAARDDARVRLSNLDARYDSLDFELAERIPRDGPGHWGNYVKAVGEALVRGHGLRRGLDGVVTADLPAAAGLASSSALACAAARALLGVAGAERELLRLAELVAAAERTTGTQGGGMDQAVSLAGRAGHAVRVDFAPLRLRRLLLPEDWRFVVAHTGVRVEKSGPAQAAYNQRRTECFEALAMVRDRALATGRVGRAPSGYPGLLEALGGSGPALDLAEGALSGAHLKRFRHVVTEVERVEAGVDALLVADPIAFGGLMDASHGSLRTDFLVSSAALDRVVATALEGGAAGARVTGAGFGGCVVALADAGSVEEVLDALRRSPPPGSVGLAEEERAFEVKASDGASYEPL